MSIAVFIPSYKRPKQLYSVISQVRNVSPEVSVYPIVEADDTDSHIGNYIINKYSKTYAGCINTAFEETKESMFFMGADDLLFYPNWTQAAELCNSNVVGTNDLHNPDVIAGRHSTHSLVSREYIEKHGGTIDGSYKVLYEYNHNYCDTEFIQTAMSRNLFVMSSAIVEHLHWVWGLAKNDETYEKGRRADSVDRQTYNKRSKLWL